MNSTPSQAPVQLDPVGPLTGLTSVLLWVIGLCWLVPMMLGMMLLSLVIHPKKYDWLSRIYTTVQVALTGSRYVADVHPAVDPSGAYMFCQNHTNHFDHVTLYHATPHFKQGLELESHFKYPVYGWFMKSRGTIPVRRGSEGQTPEIMAHMRREIQQGHSILAFPEGTRTRDGHVGRYRKGVFFIARDLGVPVVPVAVTGMYDVMRKGSLHLRPGYTVTVHVCEPIPTAGLTDDQIPELAEQCRRAVAEKVDAYWASKAHGES